MLDSIASQVNTSRQFVVGPDDAGERLDRFLARRLPGWSRSELQRLIQSGKVQLGGTPVRKPSARIRAATSVAVVGDRERARVEPEDIPLEIVYEDDDLAVVVKPSGMTVHTGAGIRSGTLVNALLGRFSSLSQLGGEARPGVVHRLDKWTSGVLIVAKNDFAHARLSAQFKARTVQKTYQALVHGNVKTDAGEISKEVGRDPVRRIRMKAGGIRPRTAVTEFRVVRRFRDYTLVEAHPRTGRTHQLRVHFASLRHPIVGDTLYGAPAKATMPSGERAGLGRIFLHAAEIEFDHPRTEKRLRFAAPLPEELEVFLRRVK